MKEIQLSQGQVAIVDDDDYPEVSKYKWCAMKMRYSYYAGRTIKQDGKQHTIYLHRELLPPPDGMVVDHINRDGLDCRRSNMRIATHEENMRNGRLPKNNTSGYMGVTRSNSGRLPWKAQISAQGRNRYIGIYATREEAAIAYDDAAKRYHGEFASTNFS